jgi:iron complex outermembrane receptor protein
MYVHLKTGTAAMCVAGQIVKSSAPPVDRRLPRARSFAGLAVTLSLLAGLTGGVAAQSPTGQLAGTVTAADTGEPLPVSRVEVVEAHRSVLTRADGTFLLAELAPGDYSVVIQQLGYDRHLIQVEVRAGETTTVDAALHLRAIELTEIVVTGALTRRAGQDVLSPISVMSGAELDRRLAVTVAGTLEGQPGLAMTSLGPVTGRPVLRGLGGDRIVMLEDGMRPGDLSSTSSDHAVAIDAANATQIEVVRGPMSLLYGSSALGGVVNVISGGIPTSITDGTHGSVTLAGSSGDKGLTGAADITGSLGPLELRTEGSARRSENVDTPAGEIVNTGARTLGAALGAAWVGSTAHTGASYRFYDNDYGIPGGFVGGHANGVDIRMRRHSLRAESEWHLPEGSRFETVRAAGSYTRYHHAELEQSGAVGTEYSQQLASLDALARHGEVGPAALGALGLQAWYRDIQTGGSLRTPSTYDYSVAGFVVEEIGSGRLRLQLGARYDWARFVPRDTTESIFAGGQRIPIRPRSFGSISGSAGLLFNASESVRLGTSVSRAYRTPDFNELYSNGPHLAANSYDVGDPSLEGETGLGMDAFLRITSSRITSEIAVFSNWLNNYIFPSSRGRFEIGAQGNRPRFQYTNEDAHFVGAEGELQVGLGGAWAVHTSASYVRARFTSDRAPIPVLVGTDTTFVAASSAPPLIPPLNGQAGIRYETPRWFGGVAVKWAAPQERLGDFETRTSGYATGTLDAGARLLLGGRFHTLTLRVDNATDAEYRDHLSRIKEILPQPGRSVVLMYRLSF